MKKTTMLKRLILDKQILVMPGAYDAVSAKIIEKLGFKAVQCTGYGIAASLGFPDSGLLSFAEVLNRTKYIVEAVNIPVMADGDTGYGNPINVHRTVREFLKIGAAGVNLEDQVAPKTCGHMLGKEIIPMREMIKKIEAAVDAKQEDPDFVLNIRTDAISAVGGEAGIEEAIKRGNAYAEAGATLIFVEAPPTIDGIKRVVREINAPVSINMLEGGKTPLMTVKELEEIGVARVSCPLTAIFASAKGIYDSLKTLREMGTTRDIKEEKLMDFREFNKLIGLPRIRELEKRFLTLEKIKAKFGNKEKLEKAKEEGV